MTLTIEQKEQLFRSVYLTRTFQRLLAAKERSMRNEARKLIKANDAHLTYHEASKNAYDEAVLFATYAKAYYSDLANTGKVKDMLIDALSDFDYSAFQEGATDVEIIDQMSQTTYSPSEGVVLNIFELLVDQAFQEWKLTPKEQAP